MDHHHPPHKMRGPYPSPSILAEPLAMTKKTKAVAALRNSTRGETAIREFANSNLTLEQLKPRAAVLLNNKELLRNVPGLTPEEQTKFLDRVDQVRRSCPPEISTHHPSKGLSYYRLVQHKIRNSLGGRVQCNQATSNLSRGLNRVCEAWHHCCGVGGVHRRLARRVQRRPSSHQSLSHISRPKFERGEGGKHTSPLKVCSNEIYSFCGNGCRYGGGYPMKTSFHSAAST